MPKLTNLVSKIIAALGCVSLCMLMLWGTFSCLRLRINYTDSLPRGLYQEIDGPIERGSYVAECLPIALATFAVQRGWLDHGYCPSGTPPILKQVVAIVGDIVEVSDKYVAVNEVLLLRTVTLKLDSQGRWLPAIPRGVYTLKEGEIFLLATNIPNSWDSRYTGPAHTTDIIATARPWLTEAPHDR